MSLLSGLFGRSAHSADEITFDDLRTALGSGACALIDVREPREFANGRAAGSTSLPLSRFNPDALPRDRKVVLICLAGSRSAKALAAARRAGRTDVVHFPGGVTRWRSLGGAWEG